MLRSQPMFNVRHWGEGICYVVDILWPDGEVETAFGKFASPDLAARWVNDHRVLWMNRRALERLGNEPRTVGF